MTPLPPSAGRALTLAEQRLHDVRAAAASCATLGVDLARVEAEARIGWEGVAARRLVPRIHESEAVPPGVVLAIGGTIDDPDARQVAAIIAAPRPTPGRPVADGRIDTQWDDQP